MLSNLKVKNWSKYGHIIDDIRKMLNCMQSWQIGHVSKVANSVVHEINQSNC
jgi:plasmid replication initiation protein